MRDVAGSDEHCRPLDRATASEFDSGQPVGVHHQPRDLTADDMDAASLQLVLFG